MLDTPPYNTEYLDDILAAIDKATARRWSAQTRIAMSIDVYKRQVMAWQKPHRAEARESEAGDDWYLKGYDEEL